MNKFLDIPKQKTFTDLGLDQFGQLPLSFAGAEINRKTQTMNEAGVPSNFIQTGDIIQRLNLIDGYLQSNNFATGSTGWRIDSDGNVEFSNGTFRGTLSAASGTLGAITIGTNAWHVDASGNMWWGSSATYAGATIKISSAGSINFTTGTFSGTLSAASGTLGAITVGTNAWHIDSSGNMWWGSSSTYSGATIKISAAGSIDFTTGTFSGTLSAAGGTLGTITSGTLNGTTITGGTIRTNGTGSGLNTQMTSANNFIEFQYDGSLKASVYSDSSGRLALSSNNNWFAFGDAMNFAYNDDNDGTDAYWLSNADLKMQLTTGGELRVEDDVVAFAGIDFAEMFESTDGKEIPVGTSVVLVNEKVRPANKNEIPFGVVSSTPGYVCNGGEADAGTAWDGKYLRNEFMRPIMEEVEFWSIKKTGNNKEITRRTKLDIPLNGYVDSTENIPKGAEIRKVMRKKINPDWDEKREYIPRSERPEWNIIGLIGRLRILRGQPVAPHWIKLRDISENVEEWLIH